MYHQQIRLTSDPQSRRRFEVEWLESDDHALAAFHAPRQTITFDLRPIDLELIGQIMIDCARAMREACAAAAEVSPAKAAAAESAVPAFLRLPVRAAEDCQ